MAQKEFKAVLDVETKGSATSIKELREHVKALKTEFEGMESSAEGYSEKQQEYAKATEALKNVVKASTKTMQEQDGTLTELDGSYEAMNKRLNELRKAWKATTSEAERSKIGEEMLGLNNQLKDMDASIGNFQRNVGDYKNQMVNAFTATAGSAGAVINPLKNMKMGLMAISSTPVVAILGLLANVIMVVINNLKSSEETMDRVKTAMSGFSSIANVMTLAVQWLGNAVASTIEWIAKMGEKLGIFGKASEEMKKIIQRQNALRDATRKFNVEEAKENLEIAKLMDIVTDKYNYNATERLDALKKVTEKKQTLAEKEKQLAREEFEILDAQKEQHLQDSEWMDKYNEAQVKLYEADTKYLEQKKEINAQYLEAVNGINAERIAREKEAEEERKRQEQEDIKGQKEENLATGGIADGFELPPALIKKQTELQIEADMEERFAEIHNAVEIQRAEATKRSEEEQRQARKMTLTAMQGTMGAVADLLESDEKTSKKASGVIKAIRIADALINTYNGATGAYTQATATIPPPWGIAVGVANAAAVVATGMANINKIRSTKIGSSNTGGYATTGGMGAPMVAAPAVESGLQKVQQVIGAKEQADLNKSQRVYILSSDIQADGRRVSVQNSETSF